MINKNSTWFYWLPVAIWLMVIFMLSSIPAANLPKMPSVWWVFWAHRIAHFGEYVILGVLVMRAYIHDKGKVDITTILALGILIFLAGGFDEWHQSFVPGRHCQLIDAVTDTIWGTLGMVVYKIFMASANKINGGK